VSADNPYLNEDVRRAEAEEHKRLAGVIIEIGRLKDRIANQGVDPDAELARLQHLVRGAADYDDLRTLGASFDFPIYRADELEQAVHDEPPMAWLIQDLIVAGTYGALSATKKAKKTFTALEMAICVASGESFLEHFPVHTKGPVLVLAGEGRKAMLLRRLKAIARHRGVEFSKLPIFVVPRVPNLSESEHLRVADQMIENIKPALVILDPLYLAIPDVQLNQLTEAARPLAAIQRIIERHGSTLLVVHHWNKTGAGTSFDRSSGVGLAEWGRFLISISADCHPDPLHERGELTDMSFELIGENGMLDFMARNRIWSDDPSDLQSELHYESEFLDEAAAVEAQQEARALKEAAGAALKATTRALSAVSALNGWVTASEVQEYDAHHLPSALDGEFVSPLKTDTVSRALKSLAMTGAIQNSDPGVGRAIRFAPLGLEAASSFAYQEGDDKPF
jgi:hypothetical protein